MKALVFCAIFFALTLTVNAQDRKDILNILETQRVSWNKGDLEAYMETYWKSDSLLFVGKNGPKFGWQTTLDNYRKSYPDKVAMGILSFDVQQIRFLSETDAFVLGAWHLKREKDSPEGYFTLLMKKLNGQWKIISDHSS
ncbi:DUF4440 domain-containing protein [Flavihumibacter sp. R14]|nr:DUF4440 domain-containing protein [Flavihumibacter soli]